MTKPIKGTHCLFQQGCSSTAWLALISSTAFCKIIKKLISLNYLIIEPIDCYCVFIFVFLLGNLSNK